jgi:hypothetical protein
VYRKGDKKKKLGDRGLKLDRVETKKEVLRFLERIFVGSVD